ncbi:MAG: glycosyltransferase [Desulforhopalus sp.]|nr:glycosyltransferase [Desulforhopalus sp.]
MRISVITVSFKASSTIEDTIVSVKSQQYQDLDYIVIDGGSSDGTIKIIKQHPDIVTYWISEPDNGIYDAMNKGLSKASGEIVGFLNADDIYVGHDVLDKVAAVFSDPTVDACYSDLVYVSPNDLTRVVRYWRSSPYREGLFAKGWCPPHPTFFVRKHIYEKFGGFDLTYTIGNDIEIMMRLLARHKIKSVYIPETTVKMRIGGTSNRNFSNVFRQNIEIIRAARNNNIPLKPFLFIFSKMLSRLGQFLRKPAKVSS